MSSLLPTRITVLVLVGVATLDETTLASTDVNQIKEECISPVLE